MNSGSTDDGKKIEASADRGHLPTEKRLGASASLDALDTAALLGVMNAADATVPGAVAAAIPAIGGLVDRAVDGMRRGGRLIYLGAGTSGRLGVLDASEIPPTFQAEAGKVVGIIAGGDGALRLSSEGKEDVWEGAWPALEALGLNEADVVVGIAAGGTTPYVWGALSFALERGCATGFVSCVPLSAVDFAKEVRVDFGVELLVGPEVVTGSTRMKSGTATKLALNMISTATMVKLGKTWGNLMIDVKASNAKLRDRALRILCGQTELSREAADALLDRAAGSVKLALVMALREVDAAAGRALLDASGGRLREVLGSPR